MSKQLIITSALPYANGPLHFGHLLEHIQTDIWVRTNRLLKEKCIYLCASDAHGTPIMMKAESEKIKPEDLVKQFTKQHEKTRNKHEKTRKTLNKHDKTIKTRKKTTKHEHEKT